MVSPLRRHRQCCRTEPTVPGVTGDTHSPGFLPLRAEAERPRGFLRIREPENVACGCWTPCRSCIWAVSRPQQRRGRVANKRGFQPEEDLVRLYLNDVG